LAKSWSIAGDRRSIVFNLRPELYSAEEVAQSLRRLIKAGQTSHSNLAAQTTEADVQVVGPLTLQIATQGDAGAVLSPLVMADAVILPDDHWIKRPGSEDLQIDWTKTKGPYIYESGSFPLTENHPIVFKPNPKHYFYRPEQVRWRLQYQPMEKIQSLEDLDRLLKASPSFSTMRYWDEVKLFTTKDPGLTYYQTRPNGIGFLVPNPKSKVLQSPEARVTLLRRALKANFNLLVPANRAKQIPQPGLSGRLGEAEYAELMEEIAKVPEHKFTEPITWVQPAGVGENLEWNESLAKEIGLPYRMKKGTGSPMDPQWLKGDYDLMVGSIGMSDTDPISGATFLFSPTAANLDLPDGRILKLLNSAKDTSDRESIVKAVRGAFRLALRYGQLIPITYTVNRHYYSDSVLLNITDPFSESIRIWEVRLKAN
jgi:ABC-type oligopeptide transport system substrate-binding subunit